jgi:hypothetical protein
VTLQLDSDEEQPLQDEAPVLDGGENFVELMVIKDEESDRKTEMVKRDVLT